MSDNTPFDFRVPIYIVAIVTVLWTIGLLFG